MSAPEDPMSALEELRARNDGAFSQLTEYAPTTSPTAPPPRVAQVPTLPRSDDRVESDSGGAPADPDDASFPRSVRAFTHVFDEPLKAPGSTPPAGRTVAVKDMVAVQGHRNRCGCAAHPTTVSAEHAAVVERLLADNWAVVGMTNLHALAYGTTGLVSEIGPAVNALDPDVVPGGSSSGSAVAVAAGDVRVAVGTDTGGSIRIPAALNGVVGFKPTHGRIPVTGVVPLAPSLDHVGPIARTVADTAAAFAAMDATPEGLLSVPEGAPLRIGVPQRHFLSELDTGTRTSFEHLLEVLDGFDSIRVTSTDLDHTDLVPAAQSALLTSEAAVALADLVRDQADLIPEELRLRFAAGGYIDDTVVAAARRFQAEWIASIDRSLAHFDVLLTPTVGVAAPRTDQPTYRTEHSEFAAGVLLQRLTSPFNVSGHPVISIPFWEDHRRIPLGVQLITAKQQDHVLLAIAERLESLLPAGPHPR